MSTTEFDYSTTVNLPKTDFPQKANLAQREPERIAHWEATRLSEKLEARTDRPTFVLHDGPPYANGDIHIGHTLNKVLKDIIIRFKSMTGFRAPYVPGWDCHGLPIEQKVVDDLREKKTYDQKSPLEIRQLCAAYAQKWVNTQREQFKRLLIGGRWNTPYITMEPKFEAAILGGLRTLVEKDYVYKGLKVVHWDPVFETALAEAEIEYNDNHTSPSIYVRFPLKSTPPVDALKNRPASIVIWTTTPWTLPANLGVSLHPDFTYVAYEVNGEVLVVVRDLLENFKKDTGLADGTVLAEFPGAVMDRQVCAHPLIAGKDSLVMLGTHVTLEQGTGCVHTAPGHGVEDFEIGAHYGLSAFCPVDEKGRFTSDYPAMQGTGVFQANPKIVELLKEKNLLVAHKQYTHSYPYSWRSRKPVIMRATEQWFMNVDAAGLREKALEECNKVQWIPGWGRDRIYNMLGSRPDWCLSRQRSWGVPIPSLLDRRTNKSVLLPAVIARFTALVEKEGTDCWYTRPVTDFLPDDLQADAAHYDKEYNCLDVWFDSGCTHLAVLDGRDGLTWPADLYLEGSDQHRGWFQSSMWVALGTRGAAPYRTVLTHGFVLDEHKRPMSKSLGNVISPLDIIKNNGADVMRMWVSSADYRGDVSISQNGLKQIGDAYRRIRNTMRYFLANLYDFTPESDAVALADLSQDDRWVLHQLNVLTTKVREAYEAYEFHRVYQLVNGFCVTELGSLYLDVVKDRLYCSAPDDRVRRSTQTALYHLASVLSRLMAPILAFTSDEAWDFIPGGKAESVHLADFPAPVAAWNDEQLDQRFRRLIALREETTRRIEPLRAKENKIIGNSLDARITLRSNDAETLRFLDENRAILPTLFIVSQVVCEQGDPGEVVKELKDANLLVAVTAGKAEGERCQRCWRWTTDADSKSKDAQLCNRCADVLRRTGQGEVTSDAGD